MRTLCLEGGGERGGVVHTEYLQAGGWAQPSPERGEHSCGVDVLGGCQPSVGLWPRELLAMGLAGNLEKEERRSLCKIRYFYSFVFIKWNNRERIPWCPLWRSLIPMVKIKLYFSPKEKKGLDPGQSLAGLIPLRSHSEGGKGTGVWEAIYLT